MAGGQPPEIFAAPDGSRDRSFQQPTLDVCYNFRTSQFGLFKMTPLSKQTLSDYMHDALPDAELAVVEQRLRAEPDARMLLEEVRQEEERGEHSIGAIWRREHISCPNRDQLGGYLLQALDEDLLNYIGFHLKIVGCSTCQANLDDLEQRQREAAASGRTRHRKIVDSSAGVLKRLARPA